ncbi:MBG domain-containing protein [Mucilaginibacter sp. AW1-7]|uniref:MBG domain-containing protein n=1 Tax=Mucilaginibacter sp. AW1-7 TaxID=3349874 RepID=UPI003F73614D
MNKFILYLNLSISLLFLFAKAKGQNQTVTNGSATTAINFGGTGCVYNWVNNTPGIGLPATGTGDIPSFTAINTGDTPVKASITVTPGLAGFAYIAHIQNNTVFVINIATNVVVAVIPVGIRPEYVSVSPDGSRVYVTNGVDDTVSVIDTKNNTVIATIPVMFYPIGVTVSPDGTKVYVVNHNAGNISVISTASNTVVDNISVTSDIWAARISPDGSKMYVTDYSSNTVTVVDLKTNTTITTISAGPFPLELSLNPDGSRLYVTNLKSNTVSVINTSTNSVLSDITVGLNPKGIVVTPDGHSVYVSNFSPGTVSVISTTTNTVIKTIDVGGNPYGISVSPDGSRVFVANEASNSVSVINTATNKVINTIDVRTSVESPGNFISAGPGCNSSPVTFTITVNPSPNITSSGNLAALNTTYGTPSSSISFLVSGKNLTKGILVTPPSGFEVSTDNVNFANTVTIGAAGSVSSAPVYLRLTGVANSGSYSGNITLSSNGATNINMPVPNSIISQAALTIRANDVDKTYGSTLNGVSGSMAFTSTGLQNQETIGSVTLNYGAGSAATDPVGLYQESVIPSSAMGGTFNTSNYNITYTSGNITVQPPVAITATGTLTSLKTIYGIASSSISFIVSGDGLPAGILVTPPTGFEVSTNNIQFYPTVVIGSGGTIAPSEIYIRLSALSVVGNYTGNILLSSAGITTTNMIMPLSYVNAAPLSIVANNKTKVFGTGNPALTVSYTGFVNGETATNLITQPIVITTAATTSPVGQYIITASGAASPNYDISYVPGILTITPLPLSISIPNTFTPNGDGVNDSWEISALAFYSNKIVSVYNRFGALVFHSVGYGIPWDGTLNGRRLPVGTYYYIISVDVSKKTETISGSITLIR